MVRKPRAGEPGNRETGIENRITGKAGNEIENILDRFSRILGLWNLFHLVSRSPDSNPGFPVPRARFPSFPVPRFSIP